MKIVWLEDEPETIEVVKEKLESIAKELIVCKSFASFSDELEELENRKDEVLVIDIRMIFNKEMEFTCFGEKFKIHKELESGFEYFDNCIKNRLDRVTTIFFSSKPQSEAKKDSIKYGVEENLIISKDYTILLINKIKEVSK